VRPAALASAPLRCAMSSTLAQGRNSLLQAAGLTDLSLAWSQTGHWDTLTIVSSASFHTSFKFYFAPAEPRLCSALPRLAVVFEARLALAHAWAQWLTVEGTPCRDALSPTPPCTEPRLGPFGPPLSGTSSDTPCLRSAPNAVARIGPLARPQMHALRTRASLA
jgi:hypothetical protein